MFRSLLLGQYRRCFLPPCPPSPRTRRVRHRHRPETGGARNGIQTQTGASTYTITAKDIQAQPGGDNAALNSVVLQMPGVAQDSFGQLHIRGEHNGLQYRLNGIILPEGISVFGQTLDPRLAE